MLTGDRERALQQSIENHGRNGKIPKLSSIRHCAGCNVLLSGHSPIVEFLVQSRMVAPALVIGAVPRVKVGRPIAACFCQTCGEKIMPHLKDALSQVFQGVLLVVDQAEAAKEAEDAVGDMEVPEADNESDGGLILP